MKNVTITINLDRLNTAQLAALQVIIKDGTNRIGMNKVEYVETWAAIMAAGTANCGDEYLEELERAEDFLSQS